MMARVEALNMAAEQAPRLAEFMGVMQGGGGREAAGQSGKRPRGRGGRAHAAADITVNFGRAGSLWARC